MAALEKLIVRLGDATNGVSTAVLSELVDSAGAAILARRFPFGYDPEQTVPPQYEDLQVRIALTMFNKIGGEGEASHSENGISRTYETGWIPESLLSEVTPKVGVMQ